MSCVNGNFVCNIVVLVLETGETWTNVRYADSFPMSLAGP